MSNPLLEPFNTPFDIPPFAKIKNEHFMPGIRTAIEMAENEIRTITDNKEEATFENTIEALEFSGECLDRIANILFNLNSAETSDELQKIAQQASPLLAGFDAEVKQNKELFERIVSVHDKMESLPLDHEQVMLLEKTYKSFVRSGASLGEKDKKRFKEISVELSKLNLTFGENVLAETNDYELIIENESDLKGLPPDVVHRAAELAKEKGNTGKWIFTLQAPSYIPFMEYADNRFLREKFHKAYMTRAFRGDDRDNREIIRKILDLRNEKASLLGFDSFAEYVLEERMAKSPGAVLEFLDDLLFKAMPKAREEVEELQQFMRELGVDHELQRWDWAYYSEKLRKAKFDFDDEILKPYFQLENVIDGVFATAGKLYGLEFEENKAIPGYHEDVKRYEAKDESGNVIAILLADFFPRKGKRPGAWMTSFRSQKKEDGKRIVPQVSIVCNFTPSSPENPSLLKFDEVKTLFHEFGHALHGMLANTQYASLSGTSVYWDFVELPSQIFENWCYEKECLDLFAKHYKTGKLIPETYIEKLRASATYHEAYATVRQLGFGLLDMAYHHPDSTTDENIGDIGSFEEKVLARTNLFPKVEGTNMSTQFGHIFAGGYAAGYYSYKWAEVLDADAFELFKEKGIFNKEVAGSFRENILSRGGTRHPLDLYIKFRGKPATADALLRRAGLSN